MQIKDDFLAAALQQLYAWFKKEHRKLSFRNKTDFYSIWVSEIMLQQTRVEAMLPIYEKFMIAFPNVQALAAASPADVLKLWSGLGYYSRARNLHAGAIQVVDDFNSSFPQDYNDALRIKGIGPYTAAAVLSISQGQRIAVVDGNVKRVLSRLFLILEPQKSEYQNQADRLLNLLPHSNPSLHNQAIMECGALICLPKNPKCNLCPFKRCCLVLKQSNQEIIKSLPFKKKQTKTNIIVEMYFIHRNGYVLIAKSNDSMFFKNHWFLPIRVFDKKQDLLYQSEFFLNDFLQKYKITLKKRISKNSFRHSITRYKIDVHVYDLNLKILNRKKNEIQNSLYSGTSMKFVLDQDISNWVVSSMLKKALS